MDDLGLHLLENNPADSLRHGIGRWILRFAPRLMKSLSVIGTAAMFLVGGGILAHNMPWVHHLSANLSQAAIGWPGAGTLVSTFVPHLTGAVVGIFAGAIILGTVRMAAGIGRTIKPE
jgi:predicted DNA repair protein MutK